MQIIPKELNKKLKKLENSHKDMIKQDSKVLKTIDDKSVSSLVNYVNNSAKYPIYQNTTCQYFGTGEEMFPRLKEEIEKAQNFIFLEYFIIDQGIMWDSILKILKKKVEQGVKVRVLYDGMCSIFQLPKNYSKKLKEAGIECKLFAPIKPVISTIYNNRDHRKIAIIDGKIAFTGGINLADEYINAYERFGYWKDSAIMLKGKAVQSFTKMFLDMWYIDELKYENYNPYLIDYEIESDSYIMPYCDNPLDIELVGENVYLNMIHNATKYIFITSPYLVLDNEMLTALELASKRGVEVKLLLPHIPDKKYAYLVARTYYEELIEAGVNIYEFIPGFIHAKNVICDDEKAVVGTINFDYRSLYLNFECAVFLYKDKAIKDILKDYDKTLKKSKKITLQECKNYGIIKKGIGRLLRMFAPLM